MRLRNPSGSYRASEITPSSLIELIAHVVLCLCAVLAAGFNYSLFFHCGLIFYGVYNVILRLCFTRDAQDAYWQAWREAKGLGWGTEAAFRAAVLVALKEDTADAQPPDPWWLTCGGFSQPEGSPAGFLSLGRLCAICSGGLAGNIIWEIAPLDAQGQPDWASHRTELVPRSLAPATRTEARRLFTKLHVPFKESPCAGSETI